MKLLTIGNSFAVNSCHWLPDICAEGGVPLTGASVSACDLRAGAAMIIAGLAIDGRTEVDGVSCIERGYDDIVGKLRAVGADIRMVTVPDDDSFRLRA